ncbi:hypothetical protein LZ31DRAFT_484790 [Colletotrichum somersetense]|nr:hypothetical protein LZ31DRAFT_484790 [Colletotrichum somersetense]
MRPSLFLSVFAMALVSEACAHYKYCHCTNQDGTTNDTATIAVCGDKTLIHDNEFTECKYYRQHFFTYDANNNCDFREKCNARGAVGDSSCRVKVNGWQNE